MMDPLLTELVNEANFDAQRYLLGCPDLAEHYAHGLDPWQHFDVHGRHEGRYQLAGEPRVRPEQRSSGVTLCAIAKDEGPYFLEWVAHHRLLGIEKIVIYNNDTSDGSERLLDRLAEARLIEHRRWPSVENRAAQISAYADAAVRCTTRWILYVDLDEFVTIVDGRSIDDLLRAFAPDVSAIAINWRIFGSAGLLKQDERPVTQRFTRASRREHQVNRHVKTIGVAADIYAMNAHRALLLRGRYVNGVGEDIDPGYGFTDVRHDRVQINHYVLKSRQEFEEKRLRGCALFPPDDPRRLTYRGGKYFEQHDLNDELDISALRSLPALKAEMSRIEALLDQTSPGPVGKGP